jgi:DNA-binding CsgD family transcriptional regulator
MRHGKRMNNNALPAESARDPGRLLLEAALASALLGSPVRGARLVRLHTECRSLGGQPVEIDLQELEVSGHRTLLITMKHPLGVLGEGELRRRFALTRRQAHVAILLAQRYSDAEIARDLGIALHTARNHVKVVRMKLCVKDRREVPGKLLVE